MATAATTTAALPHFIRGISASWIDGFNGWLGGAVRELQHERVRAHGSHRAGPSTAFCPALTGRSARRVPQVPARLLRAAALYAGRGDAHVEVAFETNRLSQRDCLHYCVAPGVLDGLALETLAALGRWDES